MTRRGGIMTGATGAGTTTAGDAGRPAPAWRALGLRILGPGLLIASGAIHLDLYLTGYRTIPTIGWLFLLQIIAAFGLGLAAAGLRHWLAPAAAAGFCLATLGGYLLTVWIGLFGFKEVRTTAGLVAGLIEVAAFAALAALAIGYAPDRPRLPAVTRGGPARSGATARATTGTRSVTPGPAWSKAAGLATAGLTAVALVLLGVAVAGAGGQAPATARGALKTATIDGATVLTNAKGFTLYSFAPDTPSASRCYGSCTVYWPPVTGTVTAGPGVTGTLGTIKRTGGGTQVTYDGHPLYTYIGDTAPGQARGNNLNLNGGLWHEIVVSG
jgi:predicted lipoprotein with Yx(FWY)xxD motif